MRSVNRTGRIALLPVVAAVLAVAGCAGAPPPVAAPAAPVASAPSVEPAPTKAPAAAPAEPIAAEWVMPNLVGVNLQDAQDRIQSLTDFGVAVTTSHDATGAGRSQVLDRNWKVCDQSIAAGRPITATSKIDFGAVKIDESC
jgi:hypothetical protein